MTWEQTITPGQANPETPITEMLRGVGWASLFSQCFEGASATSGLTFGYNGGAMLVDGVLTTIADGTTLLAASSTNYIECTRAGVVSDNATGFTAGRIPLYVATTSSSGITGVTDCRAWADLPGVAGRLSLSVAGGANVTLTAAQARNDVLNFTGVLTGNINVIVPNGPQAWCVTNNTTGAFTLTVKTSAGTGIAVTQGKAAEVLADGTNVISSNNDQAAIGAVDSDDVTYTPTTVADWDGSADPGDVEQALDQLAERVTDIEAIPPGSVATDAIWDVAGDLVYATGANTAARLAIGTARQKLRVNSGATAPEWVADVQCIAIACSDETTALTTGTAKVTFRMPYAATLVDIRASVTTAPTGGTLLAVDVNESGSTILSTKLTFDASERTTTTAATPRVISDASLADDAEMTIDIDAVGSTVAGAGLKVYLLVVPT